MLAAQLVGSLAKDFFCGNSAENCGNLEKYVLLRQERVRKFCGKFAESLWKLQKSFCNDPISELLIERGGGGGIRGGRLWGYRRRGGCLQGGGGGDFFFRAETPTKDYT